MSSPRESRALLVAGAVSYDYLVYPMTFAHDPDAFADDDSGGNDASQLQIRSGGADLVAQLLTAAGAQWGFEGEYLHM